MAGFVESVERFAAEHGIPVRYIEPEPGCGPLDCTGIIVRKEGHEDEGESTAADRRGAEVRGHRGKDQGDRG